MSFDWKAAALALVLSCVGVLADTLLKLASAARHPFWNRWFVLGLLTTASFAVLWMLLMQKMRLGTAGVFYAVASALLLVCIGGVFFGEKLTAAETAGVVMALSAVVLLGSSASQ
jgi:multidrug transporter EmrE-like cation transporter